ncbi:MAG: hypothetical protein ABI231_11380, partial [Candidatus Tumulicola sp.]
PFRLGAASVLGGLLALGGCGGSSSATSALPARAGTVQVRFIEGAPSLEALVGGVPTDIGAAYLSVNRTTVASSFPYGTTTQFFPFSAGTLSLEALDSLGYSVGPLNSPVLAAGKRYTLALVGAYGAYRVLAFEEPQTRGAALAVYAASPALPSADFGSFRASNRSNFKKLASVRFGNVATVALGASVSNFGAYVGTGVTPVPNGAITVQSVDSFDSRNALPFHDGARLSLFLFDPRAGSSNGPVFGSLDL